MVFLDQVRSNPYKWCSCEEKRRGKFGQQRDTQGECHVKTEAEIGVMSAQGKEF